MAGIGYSFYTDPERPSVDIVNNAVKAFGELAEPLEDDFASSGNLSPTSKRLSIQYLDVELNRAMLSVSMRVSTNNVTLTFPSDSTELANQTLILEPIKKGEQIRWKCLDGTVLIRYRPKDCRLGNGLYTPKLR